MVSVVSTRCQETEIADVPPVEIHQRHGAQFDYKRMAVIYFAACRQVAQEIWPDRAKNRQVMVRPLISIEIGERDDIEVELLSGHTIVRMKKWSDETFALAVVSAAQATIIGKEKKAMLARAAIQTASATVSVEELQKH